MLPKRCRLQSLADSTGQRNTFAEHLIQRFNAGAASAAANRSPILEFEVDDVDHVLSSLGDAATVVQGPIVMPWGNRSLLLRDPDGSLVNVFSRPQPAPQPTER